LLYLRTGIAKTKDNEVIAVGCKTMVFEKLIEHRLHDRVINLPFITTLSADQMVMAMRFGNLVVVFIITGICRDNQA
jgi:hypothetical protein